MLIYCEEGDRVTDNENAKRRINEEILYIDTRIQNLKLDINNSIKMRGLAMGTITVCVLFSALDLMKITTCHPAEPISRIMLVIFALYLNKKYKLINEYSTHEIIF